MKNFPSQGYVVVPELIKPSVIQKLQKAIEKIITSTSKHGIRNLAGKVREVKDLANSDIIKHVIQSYCGIKNINLIKATYFNKNIDHNWMVGWHQDKTISVQEKIAYPGFVNWTIKEGIFHVQPPLEILQSIITIRIHLTNTNQDNGALKVIPESHKMGILSSQQITEFKTNHRITICNLKAGDALIMSPLLLHSSSRSKTEQNRQVIHLEYSSTNLPEKLQWNCLNL
ncbi:MAG: phytanoyl-CoA dioxygenase family protein [Cyanobacteria bacterium P01_F01_bin.143]